MTEIYKSALSIFNEHMGTDYTVDNPELILITKKTGVELKNDVIDRLHAGNHHAASPSDFNYMRAETIIGMDGPLVSGKAAILYRTDIRGYDAAENVFLHELGHVFALTREYGGKLFFDYLPPDNMPRYTGYYIWKEFIADYIVRLCRGWYPVRLSGYEPTVSDKKRFLTRDRDNHDYLAGYLAQAGCAEEIHSKPDRLDAAVERLPFSGCIKVIAPQLRKERFWEIDEELIEDLGNAFLMDKMYLMLDLEYEKMKRPD